MTTQELKGYPKKDLADMAKRKGIRGWHSMRKDELVSALVKTTKPRKKPQRSSSNGASRTKKATRRTTQASKADNGSPRLKKTAAQAPSRRKTGAKSKKLELRKSARNLANSPTKTLGNSSGKDRIVVMVRDSYWLHAHWEVTRNSIGRAEAALNREWHASKPVLRLYDVTSRDTTAATERLVRDIDIHGGVNNWYIDVNEPPSAFRLEIGYLSPTGKFFSIARSNVVRTPEPDVSDVVNANWKDLPEDFRKIYAMSGGLDPSTNMELKEFFENKLQNESMAAPSSNFGCGASGHQKKRDYWFQVDAELIVYGATQPGSTVTLQGKPVQLRDDGSFTMRFSLPDNRQIIPTVAKSPDGVEERTIVLAIERNTKEMEPMIHDGYD